MTRYDHLSKHGEHIFSMSDFEVEYLYNLLGHGPVKRTKKAEEAHDTIREACRSLLYGKE